MGKIMMPPLFPFVITSISDKVVIMAKCKAEALSLAEELLQEKPQSISLFPEWDQPAK